MERSSPVPFVGVLTPYGDPRPFDLIAEALVGKENTAPVFVVVETGDGALTYANFFRNEFEGAYPDALLNSKDTINRTNTNIVFTPSSTFLEVLIHHIRENRNITDSIAQIFYYVPNRIPYDLNAYMNLKLLEVSRKELKLYVPNVTIFAPNTSVIPKIEAGFTIFNKNAISRAIEYELYGGVHENLYEEMARWILRTHMESPGKTICVVVPSKTETVNIGNILGLVTVPYLKTFDMYIDNAEDIVKIDPQFTKVLVSTNELLSLVPVTVDILIDSYRDVVSGMTMSGAETTFVTRSSKKVVLNRASILYNIDDSPRSKDKAGVDVIMASQEEFETDPILHPQNISKYLLMLGKTPLHPLDVWPYDTTISRELVKLQTIGALNPDYRLTSLGEFLLDVPLSPSEGTVLWHYMQEEWSLGRSCLPGMLITAMISLYSDIDNYFVYNLPKGKGSLDERKYKREKWDKFAGRDDIEVFLKVWFYIFADLKSFELNYEDIEGWCLENSMNANKLYIVYETAKTLKEVVKKYGFVCEEDQIEVETDALNLRKLYTKVYILRRMNNLGSGIFQCTSDQKTYTIYRRNAVNTLSITEPPELLGIITRGDYVFVSCLPR